MTITYDQLSEGQKLEPMKKDPVTRVQLVKYAGASGDFNPLHTVDGFAQEAGLDGVIAHGMLSMGFLGQYVRSLIDVNGRIARLKVRFKGMVYPGDVLTCEGEVSKLERTERGPTARFNLSCVNQEGTAVTTGQATVHFFE